MSEVTDLHCSICYSVFFQPITTPDCQHNFCRPCLARVIETHASCPLCRKPLIEFNPEEADENQAIAEEVKNRFADEYKEREEEWKRICELTKYMAAISFKVGNEHKSVQNRGQNSHFWIVYVRDDDPQRSFLRMVERVEIRLHPTFHPSKVILRKAPFEIHRLGWGIFEIGIKIHFFPQLNMDPFELTHMLQFDRRDSYKSMKVKTDLRLLDELPEPAEENKDENDQSDFRRRADDLERLMLAQFAGN